LLCIADYAQHDGRDACMGIAALATATKLTPRAVRYVLHKLERDGEILIEWNSDRRSIRTSTGREFCPEWFVHVRCLCEQDAYLSDEESEKFSSTAFRIGRPRIRKRLPIPTTPKPEKFARQSENFSRKSEKSRIAYKDPLEIQEQDPSTTRRHRRHVFCPPDQQDGFCVPEFLHNELTTMLGARAGEFDLLGWYVATDAKRRTVRPTVSSGLEWWRQQLRDEFVERGWVERRRQAGSDRRDVGGYVPFECPHTPSCDGRWACHQKSELDKARSA
jgi:DNA-binding MarR family transcriptional regulator